jgi:hypothetical protein
MENRFGYYSHSFHLHFGYWSLVESERCETTAKLPFIFIAKPDSYYIINGVKN